MLDRFVFIGTGGSGGRTLRFLQAELRSRLAAYGWHDDLPKAWQFLHIDVPARPDVGDAGDAGQIQYLGLTIGGDEYRKFDQQVALRGGPTLRHYTAWRPDPTRLPIDPDHGAGQYRAAGRVIGAATVERLVPKLREIVHAALNADSEDLSRLSEKIGDNTAGSGRVWTILVSSLGGGSGAGIYLDVCDILRMLDGVGIDSTIAFLYTPDIFEDIPTAAKRGLDPNTLAALCELVAATWNSDAPEPGEFALITTPDVVIPATETFRGPRRSFLVSRTNGTVTLKTQQDVYRAVAAALGAWVTGPQIQDQLSAVTTGNWDLLGRPTDGSGMTEGETQPFSSIGYASLSLGRHRFAAYAADRLAGEMASHLLSGHRPAGTDLSDAVILEDLSRGYRDIFLREAGLMEFGPTNNQVLDVLRGGDYRSVTEPLAAGEKGSLLTSVTGGRREVERDPVRASLTSSIQNRKPAFIEEQRTARERNAAKWVTQVQGNTLAAMNRSLVLNGGNGTVAVMESAARHLRTEVVTGLREEAATIRKQAQSRGMNTIDTIFAGVAKKLLADDSRLKQVVESALGRWIGESEDALSCLAADLIVDLLDHFFEPLIKSLKRSLGDLESDWQGQPGEPSPLARWASGVVGDDLLPAKFEVWLEDPEMWSTTYETLLQRQTNKSYIGEAQRAIISEVFSTSKSWVQNESPWAPSGAVLSTDNGPSTARFQFKLRLASLRGCASEQFESPGSEIQRYVRQPLSDWLAPDKELDEDRQRAFLAGLTDVQQKARPLINLNDHIAATMFPGMKTDEYTQLVTPIPLDQSHPAAPAIRRLLSEEFRFTEIELDSTFKADSDTPVLDILTTLQGPVSPLVITSLTAPLASAFDAHTQQLRPEHALGDDFWFGRRTRPLVASLPVPPHLRRAWIRGWMVGRVLGLIDVSNLCQPTIWDGDRWLVFTTLLGREPTQARHVLPAVLEGIQLALVRRPIDESVWTPYSALAQLGVWTRDDRFHLQPSKPLARWLSTGETGCGGQPNSQLTGANRDERATAFSAWMGTTLEAYEKLDAQVLPPNWQPVDRSWEIAAAVVRALGQIQSWVTDVGPGDEFELPKD